MLLPAKLSLSTLIGISTLVLSQEHNTVESAAVGVSRDDLNGTNIHRNAANAVPPVLPPQVTTTVPSATNPTTTTSAFLLGSQDYISVQWVETALGTTSRTWVPVTVTFHFEATPTHYPPPGEGHIGMGTLTGKTGQTQTIEMGGAAPTQATNWMKGVVAAVGAGVVGLAI